MSQLLKMAEQQDQAFYDDAKKYWGGVPATVDGMLGGFAHISNTDINGSTKFLRQFIRGKNSRTGSKRVLDCGAGIGRITKRLLMPLFETVDLVEQDPAFVAKGKENLAEHASQIGTYYNCGLQEFTPEPGYYDVIWCQWVLGHLTDEDFVEFFKKCKAGIRENGLIVVKENLTREADEFDATDSSYTRTYENHVKLLKKAGLEIIKEEKQTGFPKAIFEVRMFAMK
ncbi:N-terminal Xaa-Pro-Lys N-methyltransferase 1-B-like [Lineus longissimus]|uniref:N-terminal Xaa-Pro-Lys N-methyltransferase 1-B-like n=1 Tax=Lineus longissimus TaxID=88925 RepID=UPI002B4D3A31